MHEVPWDTILPESEFVMFNRDVQKEMETETQRDDCSLILSN